MNNIILTDTGAIGNATVSLKAVNGEFSGNLQCQNLTQTSDQRVKEWEMMDASECLSGVVWGPF